MSIVETVDLISSITNIDEEIDKYTDIFKNYKTMELNEIYNKSRKLLLLYFYNDNIDKVNILMEFIFEKIIDESNTIFTIEELTIQLNLMLIYIEKQKEWRLLYSYGTSFKPLANLRVSSCILLPY